MRKGAALAALLLAACDARSPSPAITVEEAWARATVPGQQSTAIYLTIANGGGDDSLVGVSSPAGDASLHSTSMTDGVARMRPLESIQIPAKSTISLKPGGMHVMLTGLDGPLGAGATIPLELRFDRSGMRQVQAAVRPAAASGAEM